MILTSSGLPDEIVAVAASYDQSLRYGAQTPFSDQLSFQWEGSIWEYDAQHNSLITAGNGGTKPLLAAFTIYYNQGTQKYQVERALQPDEQMWIDVGKLIRERVLDKNGNTLPADLTSGSYEFRDLTNKFIGNLFEGKVIFDKTYGHVIYGCGGCCGYTQTALLYNPLGIRISSSAANGVQAYTTCGSFWDDVDGAFFGNWITANPSIATVNYYGAHTGIAVGSTTSATFGYLEGSSPKTCPVVRKAPGGSDNVNPGFTVGYNAFIAVDHVTGPSGCTWAGHQATNYLYTGDANRGTYRTAEQIQIVPDLHQSSGFFQDTGLTKQYGYGSPANGSTLSTLDNDGIANDCYLWTNTGKAIPAFSYDVSFPYAHQGQVHYAGSASNPLESPLATIQWNMYTVLNTTNQQSPTAYVNYNHTCYPAHQIKVNGIIIYSYFPIHDDPNYIYTCLTLHAGTVAGQTISVGVPTH